MKFYFYFNVFLIVKENLMERNLFVGEIFEFIFIDLLFCFVVFQEMLESCSVFESSDIELIIEDDRCEVSFVFKNGFVKILGNCM